MLLDDDVIYQILLWLPVTSLLRFKLISRSWRTLVESDDFVKDHLHRHHQNPILKDKNHCLIFRVPGNRPPITFALTTIDSFEAPNECLQLDCSDLHESFLVDVYDIASFNGIVCLNFSDCKGNQCICIWNPATKRSRFLPQSPFRLRKDSSLRNNTVGIGFDGNANEYKVVNVFYDYRHDVRRVEIYNFSLDDWKSVTANLPGFLYIQGTGMPFNNGTTFCWDIEYYEGCGILCFDFITETFRSLSFPDVEHHRVRLHLGVVKDKIACGFNVDKKRDSETDVWVLTEYGSINETWVRLCRIHPYSLMHRRLSVVLLSTNGEYIFFKSWNQVCRFNVKTEELMNLPGIENHEEVFNGLPLPHPDLYYEFQEAVLEIKESLVSI